MMKEINLIKVKYKNKCNKIKENLKIKKILLKSQ